MLYELIEKKELLRNRLILLEEEQKSIQKEIKELNRIILKLQLSQIKPVG
jgi:chaperonin cofactor prefoldin